MSGSNCCFMTCVQRQVRWPGISVCFRIFQFVLIHRVKGYCIVNKAKADAFLKLSCFFDDPTDAGNLISASYTFAKSSLSIWKLMVQVLLKPGLENFELYLTIIWDECNCAVAWTFRSSRFTYCWSLAWRILSFTLLACEMSAIV